MLLNRNNFIRWSNDTAATTLDRSRVSGMGICHPLPLWKPADTMVIYFNAANKTANTGTVSLINTAGTEVAANVGTLASLSIVGGNHSYGTLTCPSVAAGYYRLKIGSVTSNLIKVVAAYPTESMLATFTHSGNLLSSSGSFIYKGASITQRFVLPLISLEFDYDNTREVYEEATTRNVRSNNQRTRKWIKFKSEYLDDDTIDAFACMLTHDTITLNGVAVEAKSGAFIEKEFDPLEKLNHIYFTMYEVGASLASAI